MQTQDQGHYPCKTHSIKKKDSNLVISPLIPQGFRARSNAVLGAGGREIKQEAQSKVALLSATLLEEANSEISRNCSLACLERQRQIQLYNALEHCCKHEGEVMEALQVYAHYLNSGMSSLDIPSLPVNLAQIEKESKAGPQESPIIKQDFIQACLRA